MIKTSNRRFLVLLVFFMCSFVNGFHYLSFVVEPTIYMEYFGISIGTISWTTEMSMLGMTVFMFPVTSLVKKINMREITLSLCLATMITSIFKCFCQPSMIVMSFAGNIFKFYSDIIVTTTAGLVSSKWFPTDEVTVASAVASSSYMFGSAASYLITPQVIRGPVKTYHSYNFPADWANKTLNVSHEALQEVGQQIEMTQTAIAIVSILTFTIGYIGVPLQAKYPPSLTEFLNRKLASEQTHVEIISWKAEFWSTINNLKLLSKNLSFVMITLSCGCSFGVYSIVLTLSNQMIKSVAEEDVDLNWLNKLVMNLEFCTLSIGSVASVFIAMIVDKFKNFKMITILVMGTYCASYIIFTLTLHLQITWLIYVLLILTISCNITLLNLFIQFGIELTYPFPVMLMSAVLVFSYSIFSFIAVQSGQLLISYFNSKDSDAGTVYANIMCCFMLLFATFVLFFTKEDYRRDAINSAPENIVIKESEINCITV